MKKFLFAILTTLICVCLLLSCNHTLSNTEEANTQENNPTESTPQENNTTESTPNNSENITSPSSTIFNIDNIKRITFYAYYGHGKGSDVTDENMAEIINWLGTFAIDKKADGLISPGTNTYCVEIEYLDGTVVREGLDVIIVDGVSYFVKSAPNPDCFWEIISKTSL